jgi:hypothetical protein
VYIRALVVRSMQPVCLTMLFIGAALEILKLLS